MDLVLTLNAWVPVAEGVLLVLQARESEVQVHYVGYRQMTL